MRRAVALLLAVLLVFACSASVFAKSGNEGLLVAAEKGTESSAPAGDTTTIGASEPTGEDTTGQENSASQNGAEEPDPELERKKELYTIGALITIGAILVGLREKRRGR